MPDYTLMIQLQYMLTCPLGDCWPDSIESTLSDGTRMDRYGAMHASLATYTVIYLDASTSLIEQNKINKQTKGIERTLGETKRLRKEVRSLHMLTWQLGNSWLDSMDQVNSELATCTRYIHIYLQALVEARSWVEISKPKESWEHWEKWRG